MTTAIQPRRITRADVLPLDEFERVRQARRAELIAKKRNRRVACGPFATFYFENYDTMWWQVHEMLRIEKGGEIQIEDELRAYNPLIPNGRELVATLMLEIEDPVLRTRELSALGGVEATVTIRIGDQAIHAVAEADIERTKSDGKTSSVHFLHFPFTLAQIEAFRNPGQTAMLVIDHPAYGHAAILSPTVRAALSEDFNA